MRRVLRVWLALVLVVGCGVGSPRPTLTPSETASIPPTPLPTRLAIPSPTLAATEPPTPNATSTPGAFPTEAFAAISGDPVPADLAAKLQTSLEVVAHHAGVSATLMSARGTWSGATGKASGDRDVTIDTQFSIASTTKAVTAAQVMQLVEAGELGLDDLAADHLPPDLDFDTNGATIRNLLGHRSGLPDYAATVDLLADPLRFWTPAELLAAIPPERKPPDVESEYANTNYLLLGLVIEEVTGRPMVEVLREGALAIDGVERMIYQPDEVPTEPIAFENSESTAWFESMGGFLPAYSFTSDGAAAAMASDSVSLGRWWQALCAGELVSQASLTEMLPTDDWYGLGLAHFPPDGVVGHYGADIAGVSLAGCVPEHGVVFAILANRNQGVVSAYSADSFIRKMKP